MIYLDYAANTPVAPQVLEDYTNCERTYIANPNFAHPLGDSARQKMAEITDKVASELKIDATGIIYTSGASEANNTAIKGIARARRNVRSAVLRMLKQKTWRNMIIMYMVVEAVQFILTNVKNVVMNGK